MIQFVKTPKYVDFYNGLNFEIYCPSHISSAGSISSFTFVKIAPADNGYFFIPMPDKVLTVDFGSLTDSAYKIPLTEDIDDIAAAFANFDDISRHYNVTVSAPDSILFTGKYNFLPVWPSALWYGGTSFNGEPVYVAGSNKTYNADYYLKVNLKYKDVETSFSFIPDTESKIKFDFSKFVGNKMAGEISTADNVVTFKNSLVFDYSLEFSDFIGAEMLSITKFTGRAFPGKMDVYEYDSWNDSFSGFVNSFSNVDIHRTSKHFLHYFFRQVQGLDVFFKIFYNDGTTATHLLYQSISDIGDNLIFIPCGLTQNNNNSFFTPGKQWYKYQIYTDLTPNDIVTFFLKPKPIDARQFVFSNRYGLYETIMFTGIQQETTKKDASTVEGTTLFSKDKLQSVIRNSYREFELSTGPKLKSEIDQVKQFFASENTYIIDTELNEFVKIHILSEEMAGITDEKEIFEFNFKYRRSYND